MYYQFDAPTEEQKVEAMTEHTDDGQNILNISETEQPSWDHEEHSDAPKQEDNSTWTHFHIVPEDLLTKECVLMSSFDQVDK